jgi:hypothetical protein
MYTIIITNLCRQQAEIIKTMRKTMFTAQGTAKPDTENIRFCKVILGMPRSAANNVAELELGRDSRKGKVLSTIAKYWLFY